MDDFADQIAEMSVERVRLLATRLKKELDEREGRAIEPIAITGMSCRFPGAPNIDAFWRLLAQGEDAITEIPADRFDVNQFYDPDPDTVGKMYVRRGGFIENVFDFDPGFFGIAPREALSMDPQQRLLLEVSWEALEDAGEAAKLNGRNAGVFIGHSTNDYVRRSFGSEIDIYTGTGSATSIAAGRISYVFGLTGPNLPVDTACSSSLVALHLACQSVREGECELALVAGVNLILAPEPTVYFCKMRALAPDGHCKTFDALANGYVRAEGCGAIVVKRLSDALADGDRIHAIIRGSAINQDGKSTGLTVPNRFAQEALLKRALAASGIAPEDVDYVEAHGTGTPLGDPIEIQAIASVHKGRSKPLFVGSVKTNFGHLEAAAGIAGVIKTALALQKSTIPKHLHFHQPNPYIPWHQIPIVIPTEMVSWPVNGSKPGIAGVSSFGFSGTNAHVVLEHAPPARPRNSEFERPIHILCVSGKSKTALTAMASRMSERLAASSTETLADICYSANSGRAHFPDRLSLVAGEKSEVQAALQDFSHGKSNRLVRAATTRNSAVPKVAFLFTGQGSQYVHMGRELYETLPAFRRALDHCDTLLREHMEQPLLAVLYPQGSQSPIDETAYSQPALFALEYSLASVWQSWGVEPSICMGHSVGELAGACVAGVFSLQDGLKLAAKRGRLMQALARNGLMASVQADGSTVRAILKDSGSLVSIAALNGPTSTVISGRKEDVEAALERISMRGLRFFPLNVSHAFHSSLIDPILNEFENFAGNIAYAPPRTGLVSNLTGQIAGELDFVTAAYWRRHAREPVQFAEGVQSLNDRGYDIYLEIGPHPVLSTLARQCVPNRDQLWAASLKRDAGDWRHMLQTLGDLYLRGVAVDWQAFDRDYGRSRVSLPTYPFQRSRYVVESPDPAKTPASPRSSAPPVAEKNQPKDRLYEVQWSVRPSPVEVEEPKTGAWLLFADAAGVAQRLASALQSKGSSCVLVEPGERFEDLGSERCRICPESPEDFKNLIGRVEEIKPCAGIVHLWPLNSHVADGLDQNVLLQAASLGTTATLHLIQALAVHRSQNPPPLWIVTQAVNRVRNDDSLAGLAQAPLWGMARSLAIEYPNLRCTRVDLEPHNDSAAWLSESTATILALLGSGNGEDQVALRGGQLYVPRLKHAASSNKPVKIAESGTYLITGGLGGLGLLVAGWMVGKGARHLVLVGRNAPNEPALKAITAFRNSGAEITVAQADIAEADQVAELFRRLRGTMPPFKGIVQAAGILDDGAILQQDRSRFERVMRPKVAGSWNLHVQSLETSLEFMVFFSSIASLLGSPAQTNYCAANAFMDSLAHYRRARGLPAISINWGPWSEAGMAARQNPSSARTWEMLGIDMLPTREGLESLETLLESPAAQVGVMQADWTRLFSLFPPGLEPRFLSEVVRHSRRAQPASEAWTAVVRRIERSTKEDAERVVRAFVLDLVSQVLRQPSTDAINSDSGFFDLGMDSMTVVELAARLRTNLGETHVLPVSFLFDHPNIQSVTDYLLKQFFSSRTAASTPAAVASRETEQAVAVIGYSCRFPGAPSEADFWDLLCSGKDAIREVPRDRWDIDRYYDPDPKAPGKMFVREGGFLEDLDMFDAQFFGISPREAIKMDPQQRLLLEATWRALENANQRPDRLRGTATSVFIGISGNDYVRAIADSEDSVEIDAYLAAGNALSIAAGRISHVFGFEGPCLAIDTACSSSLVGVHLACESLRNGKARLALAGGVNVILAPEINISLCKIGALAPDGRCKTFDASANGYVRSEGCGILVLKRLNDARADGDRILAVIRSSSINHDGRSSGLTVPNGASQTALFREVLADSGVNAGDIQYIEAHGTGTPLGDPIEMHSIASVYAGGRSSDRPLLVGSVKTNIGHLEAAAGIAGVIKVIQSMEHGKVPPNLHFSQPSPFIDWHRASIKIPRKLEDWPNGHSRFAAVSSFGFSGTNAHCILERPPENKLKTTEEQSRTAHLLTLSAKTEPALLEHAGNVANRLSGCSDSEFLNVLFSLNAGRAQFSKRLFLVAESAEEAKAELETLAKGHPGRSSMLSLHSLPAPKVAFLFTGQGSQYAGMGRRLFETQPTFRRVIEDARTLFDGALDETLDCLLDPKDGSPSSIAETLHAHPALFVLEYALARLWEGWGVKPSALLGHSIGECVAACIAGVFTFESGLKLVVERARLVQELAGQGGLLVVGAPVADVLEMTHSNAEDVHIAAVNSPVNTAVAGSLEALSEVSRRCAQRGIQAAMLNVSHAFHSPLLNGLIDDFLGVARQIEYSEPQLPIVSTVTGEFVTDGSMSTAEYWARQLLVPVQFSDSMRALASADCNVFLEVGPHPTLVTLGQQTLEPATSSSWLYSLRRHSDDRREMLTSLGQLHVRGMDMDCNGFYRGEERDWVSVPNYPFQRESFWPKVSSAGPSVAWKDPVWSKEANAREHSFLGRKLHSPGLKEIVFENHYSSKYPAFVSDHKIYSMVVVPGAAHLVSVTAAAMRTGFDRNVEVCDVTFPEGMILADGESRVVQLILSPAENGARRFRIVSSPDEDEPSWLEHCTGQLLGREKEAISAAGVNSYPDESNPNAIEPVADIQARCTDHFTNTEMFYRLLSQQGINLGTNFQWLDEIWRRPGEALAHLRAPKPLDRIDDYPIHPGWIDACFQLLTVTLTKAASDFATYLPISVGRFAFVRPPDSKPWIHLTLRPTEGDDPSYLESDIKIFTNSGQLIAAMERFRVRRAPRESFSRFAQRRSTDWLYELQWDKSDAPVLVREERVKGIWLVLERSDETSSQLTRRIEQLGGTCLRIRPGSAFNKCGNGTYEVNPAEPGSFRDLLVEVSSLVSTEAISVVHLWSCSDSGGRPSMGGAAAATFLEEQIYGTQSALNLVQALATARFRGSPKLWLVTSGAQPVAERQSALDLTHSPLWGLGRVIALELPQLRCRRVDLDPASLWSVQEDVLLQELTADSNEDQVAYCGSQRYVARLSRYRVSAVKPDDELQIPSATPYRIVPSGYGSLNEISAETTPRRAPGRGEVEICLAAAALNFRDVLNALGLYPGNGGPLGWEAAGTVTAVGAEVSHLREGDEVVALAPGSFAKFVTTDAKLAAVKPPNLNFASAAGIPVVFLTVHYALHQLAQLHRNETILIHAAAGGVGLAAVQLARRIGAEIFATAGSEEKRQYLRSLGIHHVFDSRSLDFDEAIRSATNSMGVDVVLNSLAGEYIPNSLSLLKPGGRFVEIGKIGTWSSEQVSQSRPDVQYFVFALDALVIEQPDDVAKNLSAIMKQFASGELEPLPQNVFPIHKAKAAFRYMAQAKHIGKVILEQGAQSARSSFVLRDDSTYLITGGFGGLGLCLAEWLVAQGARHFVLVGRSRPRKEAAERLIALEQRGARILSLSADVSVAEDVRQVVDEIGRAMPPLRGVFHAAGVLDDGILVNQEWSRFLNVMAPKALGAIHLHNLADNGHLDFFVMFSSAAALVGFPGQSNYAAANSFLDSFAHFRQASGRPALSINWGPWDEVGMTVGLTRQWSGLGISTIKPDQGLDTLGILLREKCPQVAVLPIGTSQISQRFATGDIPVLLSNLSRKFTSALEPTADWIDLSERVAKAPPAERPELVIQYLTKIARTVLGLESTRPLETNVPLNELGFDSLMSVELANELGRSAGISISVTLLFDYPTFDALANYLLVEVLKLSSPRQNSSAAPRSMFAKSSQALVETISSLSEDEVARLADEGGGLSKGAAS